MAGFVNVKFKIAEKTDQTDCNGEPLYRMGSALMTKKTLLEAFDKYRESQDRGDPTVEIKHGKEYYLMLDMPPREYTKLQDSLDAQSSLFKNMHLQIPRCNMTDYQRIQRFEQLKSFCEVLTMGSDSEGLDVLAETYPEIWSFFVAELEEADILCDHDDIRFRRALANLIGGFLEQ